MGLARLSKTRSIKFIPTEKSFSNFKYIDKTFIYGNVEPSAIRRLFSQARMQNAQTLILEDIEADGEIEDENAELKAVDAKHRSVFIRRLTFWRSPISSVSDLNRVNGRHLLGYALLKADELPSRNEAFCKVFESVLRKYPDKHNCVPGGKTFDLEVAGKQFKVKGVMYCQQNGISKACAQVALRSLLTMHYPSKTICYSEINQVAEQLVAGFKPGNGLNTAQIRTVLNHFGVNFRDLDYGEPDIGEDEFPYSKWLYSGIESGGGGLLGFELNTGSTTTSRHIVPFFGHTFNQDTWVPRADNAYFHFGKNFKYIPSDKWLSSFIGHDDNFGSNYCVPRLYLEPQQVKYIAALLPREVAYDGVIAESIALDVLYSLPYDPHSNQWIARLHQNVNWQDVVLRSVAVKKGLYINHLRKIKDWSGNKERVTIVDKLAETLPDVLWMVEVSIPDLFSANMRKVGEIILDAMVQNPTSDSAMPLILARLPGWFLLRLSPDGSQLLRVPSRLIDHTPLYRRI